MFQRSSLGSHLLAGVPVQCRPLQDEPEALPLLGDKDIGLLSLLPQPAVTVGSTQLAARHTTPTHGRRHSWEDTMKNLYGLWFWVCLNTNGQYQIFTGELATFVNTGLENKVLPFADPLSLSLFP